MSIRTTTRAVIGGRLRSAGGLLTGYATTSAAHLGALLTGTPALRHATKPALMPLLAAHSVTRATEAGRRAPKLLAPALLLSAGGDVLLQLGNDTAFLAGMGSFAAAHVCYVTMFVGQGALTDRRRTMVVAAAYATAWVTMVGRLWPDLGDLRAPVAGYSLLLASTAVASAGLGARGGLGGALFLLSDTLIATKLAKWRELPGHDFWIMATYLLAQYLLASGALRAAEEREAGADGSAADGSAAGAPTAAGPGAAPAWA
ncbi:lysoplasmalogenase [Kitasatospora purpeofusca]|uniref:lysoplasmalogenase n=1 Tax=Kitasatospora purpeofusca TaxID=67352 RepID=UPI002A5ADA38|nr:lysoplasmalogenase [Kitasatospora purpeofusca]MDY0810020.1 lysoplasmalogenase [Kitasatospora purpeofusca]